ncbi:MAG: hypothetical protein V4580_08055 [Bacteroidota bacterium]
MKLDFDAIIITSDEPYSKMWHTQLIYTEYLSKSNTVFYIAPPKKWKLKNIFENSFKTLKQSKKLQVLHYINRLPSFLDRNKYNDAYNERKMGALLKNGGYKKILLWHFDSYRSSFSHAFFDNNFTITRIYHVIDPFYKNPIDRWLCKVANSIVITSPRNNGYYSDFKNKVINIPQSLDIQLQQTLLNGRQHAFLKPDLPFVVLLGTISDDIDFDWILNLLEINIRVVIIGKSTGLVKSKSISEIVFNHSNAEYLGVLSPEEFYPILSKAKAGLIVYNEDRRSKVCSPLKALNYLVSNIPVITNIDCEITELSGKCIFNCVDSSQFVDKVKHALNGSIPNTTIFSDKYLAENSLQSSLIKIMSTL